MGDDEHAEASLGETLQRYAAASWRARLARARAAGLSEDAAIALAWIAVGRPLTLDALARQLGVDRAATIAVVDLLEQRRLVLSSTGTVAATARARALLAQAEPPAGGAAAPALARLVTDATAAIEQLADEAERRCERREAG